MDCRSVSASPDFKILLESAPGLYLILTPDLNIAAVTDAYLNATMTKRDDIVGRHIFDVFPDNPDEPEATGTRNLRSSLESVIRTAEPHTMATQKYDIRTPSGHFEERHWRPVNYPITNERGVVEFIVHTVEDITEIVLKSRRDEAGLKQAEDERDRFFSLSLDMLCISSHDGYFRRVSPAFTSTLGWSEQELTTTPFLDFVHPDDIEATIAEVQRQVVSGEPVLQFENRYRHKDGSWRTLSWRSLPQPGGRMYATARDVTQQHLAAIALVKAKEEAERASAAKGDFLSHMSHELRTPLNAVIGFAQLLQLQSEDVNTLESAKSILKGGRHLLSLVDEILDLARIEAGKLTVSLEPVSVADVVTQALHLVQPIADQRGVCVSVESKTCSQLSVLADRQRLLQVLLNLLSNAAKYNRPRGTVTVRSRRVNRETQRIEVVDTGIGIDSLTMSNLFKPFERARDQAESGTGLGLALSAGLMQLMGGSLSLLSTGAEGTTFALDLLVANAPTVKGGSTDPSNRFPLVSSESGLRVVYIEDNLSNIQLLERVFESLPGFELIPAMQASVGLKLVGDRHPDMVLLDLHLPDAHGVEVLQRLKSDETTADIPVVVLTADATASQMRRALAAGAKSYLTKPLDLELLIAELNSIKPRTQSLKNERD